jgi:hypothetical protein
VATHCVVLTFEGLNRDGGLLLHAVSCSHPPLGANVHIEKCCQTRGVWRGERQLARGEHVSSPTAPWPIAPWPIAPLPTAPLHEMSIMVLVLAPAPASSTAQKCVAKSSTHACTRLLLKMHLLLTCHEHAQLALLVLQLLRVRHGR